MLDIILVVYTFAAPNTTSQYITAQEITADNEALAYINTDNKHYQLSVETNASGLVERNLAAEETGYSNVMRNDAMLGMPIELTYDDLFNVESVTLKFQIADEYLDNELNIYNDPEFEGIKRLNVFKYFEDIHVLLPIETKFDISNNILYTEVDEFGVYCVMDMEKWFDMLSSVQNETEPVPAPVTPVSPQIQKLSAFTTTLSTPSVTAKKIVRNTDEAFNVVFVLDTRDLLEDFGYIKEELLNACEEIFGYSVNARVYLMEQVTSPFDKASFITGTDGKNYFTSYEDISKAFGKINQKATDVFGEYCYDSDPITHIVGNIDKTVPTYVFSVFDQTGVYYRESDAYETLGKLAGSDIYVSVIADIDSKFTLGYVYDLVNLTGGEIIPVSEITEVTPASANMRTINVQTYAASGGVGSAKIRAQFFSIILKCIYQSEFYILSANGYQKIVLDTQLMANGLNPSGKDTDTDKDVLSDWDEVDTESGLIIRNHDGTITLPTIEECVKFLIEENKHLTYVEEGLANFKKTQIYIDYYSKPGKSPRVLPITSDPTSKDSDGDGYWDINDETRLKKSIIFIELDNDYNSIKYKGKNIWDNEGSDISYGGNQGWFNNYEGDLAKKIVNYGCGLISISDILLYLNNNHENIYIPLADIVVNEPIPGISNNNNDLTSLDNVLNGLPSFDSIMSEYYTYESYMAYIQNMQRRYFNVINIIGVNGLSIASGVNEISGSLHASWSVGYYDNNWRVCKTIQDRVYMQMNEMLKNNIPVTLSIGPSSFGISFYINDINKHGVGTKSFIIDYYNSRVKGHYVTVTGILNDLQTHKCWLRISSWGKEYYIDYDEYFKQIDPVSTNILVIKKS